MKNINGMDNRIQALITIGERGLIEMGTLIELLRNFIGNVELAEGR